MGEVEEGLSAKLLDFDSTQNTELTQKRETRAIKILWMKYEGIYFIWKYMTYFKILNNSNINYQ